MGVENFRGALRTFLTADPALSAIIGQRVYSFPAPMNLDDSYIVFQRVSSEDYGNLSARDGVSVERWQFDVYAKNPDDADAVQSAIFGALDYVSYETMSGYKVHFAKRESGTDGFDAAGNGAEDGWHRRTDDYMIKRSQDPT